MDNRESHADYPAFRDYNPEDITITEETASGEEELQEKSTEILEKKRAQERGEYGCAWEKYGLTVYEAKKAGINPEDCSIPIQVSNIIPDCAGRPRTPWCKMTVKSKDTVEVSVPLTQTVEIADYIAEKDFKFGFTKAGGLGHDGILKGIWLQYYFGSRNGIWRLTHPNYTVDTYNRDEIKRLVNDNLDAWDINDPTSIEFSKKWADSNTKLLIKQQKWSNFVSAGSGVIAALIAIATAYGVIAGAVAAGGGAAAGAGGTSAAGGGATAGATAGGTGAATTTGALGAVGSAVGAGVKWIGDNAEKLPLEEAKAVYDAIKDEEEKRGISVEEASELAKYAETQSGPPLTGTTALIAAGIVVAVVVFIMLYR